MPYRRRMRRRRFRRRRPFKAQVARVMRAKTETKHKTFAADWTSVGALTGTLTQLTNISQGVTDNARVGNKITLQKIFIQKVFQLETGTGSPSNQGQLRVLLVQSRGGTLSTSDMPNTYGAVDVDKMLVLYDKYMTINGQGLVSGSSYTSTYNSPRITLKIRKIPKRVLQYDGADTSPRNYPLYLYMLAENGSIQQAGFEQLYWKDY